MVSRAKIGTPLHSTSIFQTLVLGVANYLVLLLNHQTLSRNEFTNDTPQHSASWVHTSRQNFFSARQRSLQHACAQANPSFLLDTIYRLSRISSLAYRFCLSSFQARHATSSHRNFHSRKFPFAILRCQSYSTCDVHALALPILVCRPLCYHALRAWISTTLKVFLHLLVITPNWGNHFFISNLMALRFRLFTHSFHNNA